MFSIKCAITSFLIVIVCKFTQYRHLLSTLQELESQQEWVKVHTRGTPIHPDSIKRIIYCQSDEATISCCQDHKKSLVVKHIRDEWDPYVFHIQNVY